MQYYIVVQPQQHNTATIILETGCQATLNTVMWPEGSWRTHLIYLARSSAIHCTYNQNLSLQIISSFLAQQLTWVWGAQTLILVFTQAKILRSAKCQDKAMVATDLMDFEPKTFIYAKTALLKVRYVRFTVRESICKQLNSSQLDNAKISIVVNFRSLNDQLHRLWSRHSAHLLAIVYSLLHLMFSVQVQCVLSVQHKQSQ